MWRSFGEAWRAKRVNQKVAQREIKKKNSSRTQKIDNVFRLVLVLSLMKWMNKATVKEHEDE